MCLLLVSYKQNDRFPLFVALNRDEFFERPTHTAHQHTHDRILSGIDQLAGGTWFGINRNGFFAAVTNIRTGQKVEQKPKSRGSIPIALLSTHDPQPVFDAIQAEKDQYLEFNLIFGSVDFGLHHYSNVSNIQTQLGPGLYGFSNSLPGVRHPKIDKIKKYFSDIDESDIQVGGSRALDFMMDRKEPPQHELPDTGVGIEYERKLSPVFIHLPQERYGTRSTSLAYEDKNGEIRLIERTYRPDLSYSVVDLKMKRIMQ